MDDGIDTSLRINSVIRRKEDGCVFRVLWIDKKEASYWINLSEESNTPSAFRYEDVINGLLDGSLDFVMDTWYIRSDERCASDSAKKHQQKAWGLIESLVREEPAIYKVADRAALLKQKQALTGVKPNNMYSYLGRYWRGGKTPDALYPAYGNCGKNRKCFSDTAKKPGRKAKPGATGKKLTQKDIDYFKKGISQFYLISKKPSLAEAYEDMITEFYSSVDENGVRRDLLAEEVPSFFQFKHWYYSNRNTVKEKKRREGERKFDLNNRELLEKSIDFVFGPGDAVQIDATIGDYYLVRRDMRSAIAGRPTVYFVLDVAGSMVAGLYVTFEPPSWNGALMAILNCFEDKVEYCARFGITITPDEWPCHFLPNRIVADRGEVESHAADILVNELGIAIDNTVPYRGDFKGIVEQHFHVTNVQLPSGLPGKVMKDFGERGAIDCRLEAKLDIYQYTAMIIHQTLFYNNHHWMKTFVRTPNMRLHHVRSIPRDIWNYGMRYFTGGQKTLPREKIRQAVLPRGEGKIDRYGICFNGLYYTCEQAEKEEWFAKADISGTRTITVAYNPLDAAFIYVLSGQDVVECHLVKYHEIYCGTHVSEVQAGFDYDKNMEAAHRIHELNAKIKMKDAIDKIVSDAENMAPDMPKATKAERLSEIHENRAAERAACIDANTEASLKAAGLLPEDSEEGKTQEVEAKQKEPLEPPPPGKKDEPHAREATPLEKTIDELLEAALSDEDEDDE